MIVRTKKANEPHWKKPWIDRKTGKRNGGFWYFNHNGKRQTLTKCGAPPRKTRGYKQALQARDRFLSEVKEAERDAADLRHLGQAQLQEQKDHVPRVLDVINFYLTNHRRIAASSRPETERILVNFATGKDGGKNGIRSYRGFGKLPWNQLGNEHIAQWVDAHRNWNELSAIEVVKRAFNYAVKHRKRTGVKYNPIADWQPRDDQLERFTLRQPKAYFRTKDEEPAFGRYTNPQFRLFFDANIHLGTRPGEIAKLTTQSVQGLDGEFVYWQLEWHEWKNGRRTQQTIQTAFRYRSTAMRKLRIPVSCDEFPPCDPFWARIFKNRTRMLISSFTRSSLDCTEPITTSPVTLVTVPIATVARPRSPGRSTITSKRSPRLGLGSAPADRINVKPLTARMDPLCNRAARGHLAELQNRNNLWALLLKMTHQSVRDQIKYLNREKRGAGKVRGDSVFFNVDVRGQPADFDQFVGAQLTPEFLTALDEQYLRLLGMLRDDTHRKVALWRMEGYTNREIAQKLGIATGTVERKLRNIREHWSEELES